MNSLLGLGKDIHSELLLFFDVKSILALKQTCQYFNKYIYNFMELNFKHFIKHLLFAKNIILLTPTYIITPMITTSRLSIFMPLLKIHMRTHMNTIKFIKSNASGSIAKINEFLFGELLYINSNYINCELPKLLYLEGEGCARKNYPSLNIVRQWGPVITNYSNTVETFICGAVINSFKKYEYILLYIDDNYSNCKKISLKIEIINTDMSLNANYESKGIEELYIVDILDISYLPLIIKMLPNLKLITINPQIMKNTYKFDLLKYYTNNKSIRVQPENEWIASQIISKMA